MTDITFDRENKQLCDIWIDQLKANNWPSALERRWPLQYPPMSTEFVLLIGLNPSHNNEDDVLVRDPSAEDLTRTDRIRHMIQHQERTLKKHKYFSKHGLLVGSPQWNHIDVLAVRHTKQEELKDALDIKDDGTFNSEFVERQLGLMLRLVDALNPRAIVVVNALAATMLRKRLEGDFDHNDEDGFHFRRSAAGVPWLFSGMLTGGVLDRYSFERLRWHLQRFLRKR